MTSNGQEPSSGGASERPRFLGLYTRVLARLNRLAHRHQSKPGDAASGCRGGVNATLTQAKLSGIAQFQAMDALDGIGTDKADRLWRGYFRELNDECCANCAHGDLKASSNRSLTLCFALSSSEVGTELFNFTSREMFMLEITLGILLITVLVITLAIVFSRRF